MDIKTTQNMALRIAKIEEEIKDAKDTLWRMMVEEVVGEQMDNLAAYIRYLEIEKK